MVGVRWQEEISRGKGLKRDPHSLIGSLMYDVELCIICEKKLWPPKSLTWWTSPRLIQLTGPGKVLARVCLCMAGTDLEK